jgi:hypothetical protein
MRAENAAQELLVASGALTALVAPSSIRTEGDHQDLAPPYIIHGAVQERPVARHDTPPSDLYLVNYEVNCVAQTLESAYEIGDKATDALRGAHSNGSTWIFSGRRRSFNLDARVWVVTLQFTAAISA